MMLSMVPAAVSRLRIVLVHHDVMLFESVMILLILDAVIDTAGLAREMF